MPHSPFAPRCVAAMGSMTSALRAQRILGGAGLSTEIVSLSPEETRRGCAYGVEIPCADIALARQTFRAAGLTPSQYIERKPHP